MRRVEIFSFVAATAALAALVLLPISSARAEAQSILAGDEKLETWIAEMQAEILFDVYLMRAEQLGDKGIERVDELWGEKNDANSYRRNYVILHTLLSTINNYREHPDVDRTTLTNVFTSAMESRSILHAADVLTDDEGYMVDVLVDLTRARIECQFGGKKSKDRAYKAALKSLKKADPEMIARSVSLAEAYRNDPARYEGLSADERSMTSLEDEIAQASFQQAREEGYAARIEVERDYCGYTP